METLHRGERLGRSIVLSSSSTSPPPSPTEPPPLSSPDPTADQASRPLPDTREGVIKLVVASVEDDQKWIEGIPTIQTSDAELSQRLLTAYHQPTSVAHNETLRKTLQDLLRFGLVVDCLPSTATTTAVAPPSSSTNVFAIPTTIDHYIAHTLLNHCIHTHGLNDTTVKSPYLFKLTLGQGESIAINARSRFMLWYLAERLHLNIVLFSTRGKAHLYTTQGARATIGFLHHIDSYHGTSEYLVLRTSTTPPASTAPQVIPSAPAVHPYAPATVRTATNSRRHQYEVSNQDCKQAVEYACQIRLRQIIETAAETLIKKHRPPAGMTMDEYRISESQRLHHDEVSRIRLPRHTMEIAVLHLRESRNLDYTFNAQVMANMQRTDANHNIGIYQGVVRSRFHTLWDSALMKAQQSADKKKEEKKNKKRKRELHDDLAMGDKDTGTPMGAKNTGTATDDKDDGGGEGEDEEDELEKEKEKLRTCTVPLKAIIRQDLVDLQYEILETIQNRQLEITDDITELSVLLQKSVLSIAAGNVYDGRWQADPMDPKIFDVRDLLPANLASRAEHVDPVLRIARIPVGLQDAIEKALDGKECTIEDTDVANVQSQGFLQYLHATFLGNRGVTSASKDRHPIWELLAQSITSDRPIPKAPSGLSQTITEAVREFTTAFSNLWEGAIYNKMLDYLLRILLRVHLAPQREEKTRQIKKNMVEKKEAQARQRSEKGTKTARSRWKGKAKLLFDELCDLLESGDLDQLRKRVPTLTGLLKGLSANQPAEGVQTHLLPLSSRLDHLDKDSDSDDDDDDSV
ncbi:hypothetical protein BGZ75_010278, partial [Mortierella antarctica]